MVTYTIKKVGTLKYPRLEAISIYKKHIQKLTNSYQYIDAKELLDSIVNNTFDEQFSYKHKCCFDLIFEGMEYIEHDSGEPEYPPVDCFPSSPNDKCVECGSYHGHSPKCSLMDEKCAKEMLAQYYDAWLKMEMKHREHIDNIHKKIDKAKRDAEFWKGKFVVVKNENNALRRKVGEVYHGTQKQFCGRNVTTCIYFVEGRCKNAPSECRDQVTKLNKK